MFAANIENFQRCQISYFFLSLSIIVHYYFYLFSHFFYPYRAGFITHRFFLVSFSSQVRALVLKFSHSFNLYLPFSLLCLFTHQSHILSLLLINECSFVIMTTYTYTRNIYTISSTNQCSSSIIPT